MGGHKDWREMMTWCGDLLERRTGEDVATWNQRVRDSGTADEAALRRWLGDQG
jgi:hypothetical protein